MRKIFLDCGANRGQSIEKFIRSPMYSNDFIIFAFEPFPMFARALRNRPNITFSDKAVWIRDEKRDFYPCRTRRMMGSSLKSEKISGCIDKEHPITVKCFDFSKWIMNHFTKEDYIILKMDIEGAEYEVLKKMIEDKSIYLIKKAFIEFHLVKMEMNRNVHDDLIRQLSNISGFELLPELDKYIFEKKKI